MYDFAIRILFERLWLLFALGAAVELVLLAVWSWRRTARSARRIGYGLAGLALLVSISLITVTERERIERLCQTLAEHVENGAIEPIVHNLAVDFEASGLDRDAFAVRLKEALTRWEVSEVSLRRIAVTVPTHNVAIVDVHVTCRVRSAELPYELLVSDWQLRFTKDGKPWKLRNVERIPDSGGAMDRLSELLP